MHTINDIEIFITTHNRARLIGQSLESLLAQTAAPAHITVLDNESTDNTKEIVLNFKERGVSYIRTEGFLGNYLYAKKHSSKPFTMLFHDDDILHPGYLALALKALNKYKNVSLVTCRYTEFFDTDTPVNMPEINEKHYVFETQKDWAAHMYFLENIAYAPAIWRTETFKKINAEYEEFNKFNDWPLLIKAARHGTAVLLDDRRLFYVRRHKGQDTWTNTNIPSLRQIVNWDKFFYNIIKPAGFIEKQIFGYKNYIYMHGKYNAFIPPEQKAKTSAAQLEGEAAAAGLPFSAGKAAWRNLTNKLLKRRQRKLSKAFVKESFNG